jgi:hypothetical protein
MQYEYKPSQGSYIDALVDAKLLKLRLPASGLCTDEEFVRRATVDITGMLPTEEETVGFLANADPNKRAALIETLLGRKEFSEIWAMKWADLLMIKSNNQVSYKAAYLYYNWLINQIASNTPLDKIVRELLTATGGTFQNPATNFYQVEQDRLKMSENVAQVFMGIRTQCAQCHNHPFDKWSQMDYYKMAAFTYGVDTRGDYGFQQSDFKTAGKARRIAMEDREMLEDLMVVAYADAFKQVEAASEKLMSGATAGMPMPPGFKLPF